MKKIMGLGAMLLAGSLVIPGNLWLASPVLAQSDSKTIEDKQLQELRQKRQEEWQERERREEKLQDTGKRRQDAIKRQQDASKRQKAAEQRLRELAEEEKQDRLPNATGGNWHEPSNQNISVAGDLAFHGLGPGHFPRRRRSRPERRDAGDYADSPVQRRI